MSAIFRDNWRRNRKGRMLLLLLPIVVTQPIKADNATSAITPIDTIKSDDPQYLFLHLGTNVDYLEAERWRIIDQIEQAIPPLYEPVRPLHGYTLPPGAFRISLNSTLLQNNGDFGTDDFYSLFFKNVEVRTHITVLDLAYGFEAFGIKDLVAQLSIPYKSQKTSGSGHPFRIETMEMTMEGAASGLGDISLTFKKKWFDQANSGVTVSTFTGIIFPSGDDEEEFNASQTISVMGVPADAVSADLAGNPAVDAFGRETGDLFFPRTGQPGNGSWGLRLGAGLTRQFERSALHAGAIYDVLADNDGIEPGDEMRYGISYVFPPFQSDYLSVDLALVGAWKGDEKFPGEITHAERDPATGGPIMDDSGNMAMFTTARPDFKHGNILFFSPSITYFPSPGTKFFVSPAIRIMEPHSGPSPEWTLMFGLSNTF